MPSLTIANVWSGDFGKGEVYAQVEPPWHSLWPCPYRKNFDDLQGQLQGHHISNHVSYLGRWTLQRNTRPAPRPAGRLQKSSRATRTNTNLRNEHTTPNATDLQFMYIGENARFASISYPYLSSYPDAGGTVGFISPKLD